jgi:transposase
MYTKLVQEAVVTQMRIYCDPRGEYRWKSKAAAQFMAGKAEEYRAAPPAMPTCFDLRNLVPSARTIRRWFKHYEQFGELPCQTKRELSREFSTGWDGERDDALKRIVDHCPVLYLDEIAAKLKTEFGEAFAVSSIWKRLKAVGYTRKVVYAKATQAIAAEQRLFIEVLRQLVKTPEMAIFVDETAKGRNDARRKYGWSKVNTQVDWKTAYNVGVKYTVIAAADYKGFVLGACATRVHMLHDKQELPPMETEDLVEYVERRLVPFLGNYERREPHSVVVMDNVGTHLDGRVRELIEAAGARLVYSAPYSPELIPIEYMFSKYKAYLSRHHIRFNRDWHAVHMEALRSITPQMGINYFKNTTLVELVENHPDSEEYMDMCEAASTVLLAAGIAFVVMELG